MNAAIGYIAIAAVAIASALIGFYGLRVSRTTSDFYVASRTVRPWWNASAIGGEYLSAASFLGIAGLILLTGSSALWFPIGYTAGYLMKTAFTDEQSIAAPVDAVWTRLTDWSGAANWMPGVDSMRADGPLAVGTVLHFVARGKERTSTITAIEPGRALTMPRRSPCGSSSSSPFNAKSAAALLGDGPARPVDATRDGIFGAARPVARV